MEMLTGTAQDYWRGALVGCGFTSVPRCTLSPEPGIGHYEAPIPNSSLTAPRRLADEIGLPLRAVLLAAHAKVLTILSGERDVVAGYVVTAGGPPLPCRLTLAHTSWRRAVLDIGRVEADVQAYADLPIEDIQRELGRTDPLFETVFDPTGADRDLAGDTVLQVSILRHGYRPVVRLRYRTEVLDAASAARIAAYHLTALTLIAADPDGEHERQSLLSAEELRFHLEELAGPRRELPDRRVHELLNNGYRNTRTQPLVVRARSAGAARVIA